jgi:hypothetical protein
MLIYPWQWLTAASGQRLTLRMPHRVDVARLQADFEAVRRDFRPNTQDGPHHNGKWKRLGLISPDGDPFQAYLRAGQTHRPTPVLDHMPYVRELIGEMGFPVRSAFISVMDPGARVRWHRDLSHSIDLKTVRLHLPIVTHETSIIRLGHETGHWRAGEMWYGDFSFPHSVRNDWDQPRVHIIFDVHATDEVRAAFPADYIAAAPTRKVVRKAVAKMFDFSEHFHAEGRKSNRMRAERWANAARPPAPQREAAE